MTRLQHRPPTLETTRGTTQPSLAETTTSSSPEQLRTPDPGCCAFVDLIVPESP